MNYGLPNQFQPYGSQMGQFQGFNQGMQPGPMQFAPQSVQSVEQQRARLKYMGLDDSAIDNLLGAKQGLLQMRDDAKTDLRSQIIGGENSAGEKVDGLLSGAGGKVAGIFSSL